MCHCAIHVLSGLDAREHLWPLRDHWADNSRGRPAPTPSLVCHFVLDAPLRVTIELIVITEIHETKDTPPTCPNRMETTRTTPSCAWCGTAKPTGTPSGECRDAPISRSTNEAWRRRGSSRTGLKAANG